MKKAMTEPMTETMLSALFARFPLAELSVGDYAEMKAMGMKFSVRAYRAEGLGHVSVMTAQGFFGLMKMDTLIINPRERDLPLLSYDRVLAMGNDTLIYELYDTAAAEEGATSAFLAPLGGVKAAAAALPEHDLGCHWYDTIKLPESLAKKGKKPERDVFDACALDYFKAYLAIAEASSVISPEAAEGKRKKASVYVEGLLANGGPSTDIFKKKLGLDKTAELFQTVLFGTAL